MIRVYLAVGHGLKSGGSFDPGTAAGSKTEQSEGDKIVKACADRLRAAGVEVRDEAYSDDPNWPGSAEAANAWSADYAIAVHHDWPGAPRGGFGHWHEGSEGEELADAIYGSVEAAGFPMRPDWHKARSSLGWLRRTNMPAVLWECDRIGRVSDHTAYGHAIADGILAHLGIGAPDTPDAPDSSEERRMFTGLKHGDRSDLVEEMQRYLNQAGADPQLKQDGVYKDKTAAAVTQVVSREGNDTDNGDKITPYKSMVIARAANLAWASTLIEGVVGSLGGVDQAKVRAIVRETLDRTRLTVE